MGSLFWGFDHIYGQLLWWLLGLAPLPILALNHSVCIGIDFYKEEFLLRFPVLGPSTSGIAVWDVVCFFFFFEGWVLSLKKAPPACCHRAACTGSALGAARHFVANFKPSSANAANYFKSGEIETSAQKFFFIFYFQSGETPGGKSCPACPSLSSPSPAPSDLLLSSLSLFLPAVFTRQTYVNVLTIASSKHEGALCFFGSCHNGSYKEPRILERSIRSYRTFVSLEKCILQAFYNPGFSWFQFLHWSGAL